MEKSVITPDQYPLSLNALVNACNQKSSREPVLSLEQNVVQRTVNDLIAKQLVMTQEFGSRVDKYQQRFCNTHFAEIKFSPAEFAVVCLLLLRGPQTPGELKAHSGRLHEFADPAEVDATLESLLTRTDGPFVARNYRASRGVKITPTRICSAGRSNPRRCRRAPPKLRRTRRHRGRTRSPRSKRACRSSSRSSPR